MAAAHCGGPATTSTKRNNNNHHNFASSSSPSPRQSSEQAIDSSPPRTPKDQTGRNQRLKGIKAPRNRPSLREAFDIQDNTAANHERDNSNGLSWSPNHARNSVVDSILLSLDNFGFGPESAASHHPNNHTAETRPSLSSDYSNIYETPPTSRHRSNSAANFQSSLGRIDSVRVNGQEQEDFTLPRNRTAARVNATGRDSGSSSLELERPEPSYKSNRRSQSFDHGYTRMALKSAFQDPSTQEEAEGALLPSVPRTQASSTLKSGAMSATLPSNVHRQRGNARSPARASENTLVELTPNKMQEIPSHESNASDGTPAKVAPIPTTPGANPGKENQKQGFFRKMFGSSRASQEASAQKKYLQRPPTSSQARSSLPPEDNTDHHKLPPLQKAPTREKSAKDPQTLSKKSSFFRRRRKSLQDSPMPQVPQVYQDRDDTSGPKEPESPGSLQKVMDQCYESHTRLDSRGSIANSRRKNSLPSSGVFNTIRAVGGPTATENLPSSPTTQMRTLMDKDSKGPETPEHRRPASGGSKLESREKVKSSTSERKRHSPAHTRTQSDVDKDLPRLPVDYSAMKSPTSKDVPTSRYNQTTSKPASRESTGSISQTHPAILTPSKLHASENSSSAPSPRHDKDSRSADARGTVSSSQSRTNPVESKTDARTSPIEPRATPSEPRATPVEDSKENDDDLADETREALMFSVQDVDGPSEQQRTFAQKLFDGTSGIDRTEVAAWLGEANSEREKIRQAYMELFDWNDLSILGALRSFCNHVQLKGETQQVDRLLDALSQRWCDCNPKHGFKATDIEQKMTRGQFIKNTLPTIRRVVADAAPHAFDNARSSMLPPRRQTEPIIVTPALSSENASEAEARPTHRLQNRPSDHSGHDTINDYDDCGPLVKMPFNGKLGGWETQIEVVLKNFYISIRNQRLPLSGGEEEKRIDPQQSTLSLSAATGSMLRRTNSMLSKAGSETLPARGRVLEPRIGNRWSSKGRSRPRLYPASLAQSRTSFDDDQSAISPSMSSMWSKHSMSKTTMSVTSFASAYPNAEYQRSIGFANALSQAITRNDSADESTEEFLKAGPLLEDESLELEGAPWAKEGILKHKHHLESVDKKAKDRNWNECFAVIEKGWIRLFQFNMNSKSMRQRSQRMMGGGVVGGGNWSENAQSLGHFLLRHTIASALPPPGYSKARPHVWALSLPTGAVHLFQAGTPEIVKEFVSTANYWSARLSKEPLVGGVSNIEYGWSERVINMALIEGSRPPSAAPGSRPSMSQSIRTSFDQASSRPKLPGDKAAIADWSPPTQSMMASQLLEVDQLRALQTYVANIEEELRKHNELRSPMLLAFTPRQSNHARAMNNWERKSSYLLREIVKFSTYLESLQFAQKEMDRVKAEKKAREEEKEKKSEVQNKNNEPEASKSTMEPQAAKTSITA